ncbi:hypothetical protein [Halobacillus hunanensis]|uniref:hypothetical protein n=1 Tax=Halobacillus hunanensis TaxID=578214 RepID=UPI0009A79F4C|nr:hypothetical protein [Halobacillus hunanensis]
MYSKIFKTFLILSLILSVFTPYSAFAKQKTSEEEKLNELIVKIKNDPQFTDEQEEKAIQLAKQKFGEETVKSYSKDEPARGPERPGGDPEWDYIGTVTATLTKSDFIFGSTYVYAKSSLLTWPIGTYKYLAGALGLAGSWAVSSAVPGSTEKNYKYIKYENGPNYDYIVRNYIYVYKDGTYLSDRTYDVKGGGS